LWLIVGEDAPLQGLILALLRSVSSDERDIAKAGPAVLRNRHLRGLFSGISFKIKR